jgi:acetylornithine deacetylase
MTLARGDAVGLTAALVRVDSRNPSLAPGAPGEAECARVLAEVLRGWGFAVEVVDAAPGRPNVVARLSPADGAGRGRSLLLNGHLDVVGIDGMTHAPFDAEVRDGRLYGRGSCDMKGGIAAMCAAAVRARDAGTLGGEVIVAAVADEEYQSLGTRALVASGVRADGAIVTEPTRLRVMPAHRGFAWVTATVRGRAAHGSRWEIGVDAIRHAGLLLAELDALDVEELPRRVAHPLLGRPSLHASLIEGGTGLSTYPDRCVVRLERRTIPGEPDDAAVAEVRAACERVRARRPSFDAEVSLDFAQPPSDVRADAPLVRAVVDALGAAGEPPAPLEGMSAWTDAALLNAAGIPAICFGPGDIALAHAATEYVPVDEIERATDVLARLLATW